MNTVDAEASLGTLLGELASKTGVLVRQEVQLAKTEATVQATTVGKQLGLLAAGGALAQAGLLVVLFAVVVALGGIMPTWLAAVVVAVVVLGAGAILVAKAMRSLRRLHPLPATRATFAQDASLLREPLR
ncbi:MAG TPA: phage holin family protein [Polyangiaceae bacterium]|jgi:uncharacterized membrane protein YqjE